MTKQKQCWECMKRRLVCDFTRPSCKKCSKRGIECPGYGRKPLKWKPTLSVKPDAYPVSISSLTSIPDSNTCSSGEDSEDEYVTSCTSTNRTTPDVQDCQQLSLLCPSLINGEDYYPFQAVEYCKHLLLRFLQNLLK